MELLNLVNVSPELLAKVVPIVLLTLGCMSGLSMMLNAIAKFTENKADDKVADIVAKLLSRLQKLVDLLSGNVKH